MNISDYLNNSPVIGAISETYVKPEKFLKYYFNSNESDAQTFLRHVMQSNTPYIFKDRPLIFEKIKEYLSNLLSVELHDILLIGSAKTGFSLSTDNYGRPFTDKSDLDFTIINETLFQSLKADYDNWKRKYTVEETISPTNLKQKDYWDENVKVLKRNLNRGFIDTYKLPNMECCPTAKTINNAMYNITLRLENTFGITSSKASVRVYQNSVAFVKQLRLNTNCLKERLDK